MFKKSEDQLRIKLKHNSICQLWEFTYQFQILYDICRVNNIILEYN